MTLLVQLADELYRLLVESVGDYAIFVVDPEGRVQSWNLGAQRIKGYDATEIIGSSIAVFYTPEDRAAGRWEALLATARDHGRAEDTGWRVRKDGSRFWASVVITVLRDATGTPIGFAKVTRDLTDLSYRAFVEASNAIVWTTDPEGNRSVDSPSWRAFTGQNELQWREAGGHGVVHPDDLTALETRWAAARATRQPLEIDFRVRRHDGQYVWMACRAVPLLDAHREVREWFGVMFDISARKAAEHAREHALALWTTTLRSIGDGVIATDAAGRVTFMNPVAEALTGWASAEGQGRELAEVFPIVNEDTRTPVENPVHQVLRDGAIVGLANHTLLIRRDGTEIAIDDSAAPIRSPGGALDGVVLVFRDATTEKLAAARRTFLASAGEQLLTATDYRAALVQIARLAVPRLADWCAVHIVEPGTTVPVQIAVAHVDPAKVVFAEELGRRYPADPDATTGAANVVRTGRSELYVDIAPELLERGAVDDEHRRIIRELDLRSAMVVPLRGRATVFGALTFVYTGRRRYSQADLELAEELARRAGLVVERRRLEEEAQVANRAKDEFLATISHELRTPLQAIVGWATMLRRGISRDYDKGLDTILRNASAQTRLVDDILDVSRIISGKLRLAMGRVDVTAVIRTAVETVRPAAAARQQQLVESIAPDLGDVEGDPDRLQQVVWNLLHNAVKFTPKGGRVTLTAERTGSTLQIRIADTGKGIAPGELHAVFERFRQSDSSITRDHSGLGLGLAIVRYLVEAHGGQVRAESAGLGHGATFSVELPLRAITNPRPAAPSGSITPQLLAGLHVLVVDDEEDARELLGVVLADAGARVDLAGSAAEAFAKLTAEPPNVIISDIGMPGEDGYSLLRRIRLLGPAQGGDTPAIALTAYARAEDVRRAEEAGFQLHLVKPAEPRKVIDSIRSVAGG